MKAKIKSMYRPYKNGMYTDKYLVTYDSGRNVWYDLNKFVSMPLRHFMFMMNAKCVPIYANKHNGEYEGQHIADKYITDREAD